MSRIKPAILVARICVVISSAARSMGSEERPNILFFLVDDMGVLHHGGIRARCGGTARGLPAAAAIPHAEHGSDGGRRHQVRQRTRLLRMHADARPNRSFSIHFPHGRHNDVMFTTRVDGDWKLIYQHASREWTLTNPALDPGERENMIAENLDTSIRPGRWPLT